MLNPIEGRSLQICYFTKLLLAGLLIGIGISTSLYPVLAQQRANQSSVIVPVSALDTSIVFAKLANGSPSADGVYLFGQSAKPGQIQQEYFVFELENDKVMGAFYMPYSSFDCFYGHLKAGELNLTITSSYDKAAYPYSVSLKDYQPISSMSTNDQRILNTCKAAYQAQLSEK